MIVDEDYNVVVVLVGRPKGNFISIGANIYQTLQDKVFPLVQTQSEEHWKNRRGSFPAVDVGISRGGGMAVSSFSFFAFNILTYSF